MASAANDHHIQPVSDEFAPRKNEKLFFLPVACLSLHLLERLSGWPLRVVDFFSHLGKGGCDVHLHYFHQLGVTKIETPRKRQPRRTREINCLINKDGDIYFNQRQCLHPLVSLYFLAFPLKIIPGILVSCIALLLFSFFLLFHFFVFSFLFVHEKK